MCDKRKILRLENKRKCQSFKMIRHVSTKNTIIQSVLWYRNQKRGSQMTWFVLL